MASAADVPNIYDLVIGSNGYVLANSVAPDLPFRTQRAKYGYTPTFIERSNVTGDFGDNQQDFWLTATQRDWSLGAGQFFFHSGDPDKARRFATGDLLDTTIEGQIATSYPRTTGTVASGLSGANAYGDGIVQYSSSTTHLYRFLMATAPTDLGLHGAGGAATSVVSDGVNVFLTGPTCTSIRKLVGGVFSAFCATPMDCIVFINNSLYGCKGGTFYAISSAGVATPQFTFKDGLGVAFTGNAAKMIPFGGRIAVIKTFGNPTGPELFLWDGSTGMSKIADFPSSFFPEDVCVTLGTIYVAGIDVCQAKVVVYSYDGSLARPYIGTGPADNGTTAIAQFCDGFVVADYVLGGGQIVYFDATRGSMTPISTWSGSGTPYLSATDVILIIEEGSTTWNLWKMGLGGPVAQAYYWSSSFDMESSLRKVFRGVTVSFVGTGSVDVSYALDGGSETSLATGVTSGVETLFPANTIGSRMELKVILNNEAIVTRTYLRAAPLLSKYRTAEYILDMSGVRGKTPVQLHNGNSHRLDGQTMLTAFLADVTGTNVLSFTDRLGTFAGIVDLSTLDVIEVRPKEFLVRFAAREI